MCIVRKRISRYNKGILLRANGTPGGRIQKNRRGLQNDQHGKAAHQQQADDPARRTGALRHQTRLSEAAETAKELVHMYKSTTIVDTILCLDGTQVIGTCMANELTKDGFRNMNAHQTIYIITPEYTSGSQIILRDNIAPMVRGRHVLILSASITTGYSIKAAVEAVQYYGGQVAGLAAIFATTHEFMGMRVNSIFDPNNLPDYQSYESRDCPMCKAGQPIDALVNSFGYSSL